MSDRDHAAGRTGMGTVMGSKNVKAIVVKKQRPKVPSASDGKLNATIQRYLGQIKASPHYAGTSKYGGAGYVKWADDLGILATRNYRENTFEAAERIDGKNLKDNITRRRSCHRCPVHCKADLEFTSGKYKGIQAVRPEFESMLSLGSKCGLGDLDTLVFLDNLCSRLGIDSISAGNAIAFAMDLFERGIISLIGRGAEQYAPHVKGLELAGYHPDNIMGTALGYAVASRGGDFNDVFATLEYKWLPQGQSDELGEPKAADLKSIHGKAELVRRSTIIVTALDGLGLCKIPALCLICAYDLVGEAELAAAITGWPLDASALFISGERIVNMERLFNLRYGVSSADDRLPDMFFEKDYNAGEAPSKPHTWMEPMIQEFYDVMGWDQQGRPTSTKLAELSIFAPHDNQNLAQGG
jgi:aldehyde:ferredoxin oxidoreductase